MRFEDGRIDQFVSDKKLISTAEKCDGLPNKEAYVNELITGVYSR